MNVKYQYMQFLKNYYHTHDDIHDLALEAQAVLTKKVDKIVKRYFIWCILAQRRRLKLHLIECLPNYNYKIQTYQVSDLVKVETFFFVFIKEVHGLLS